jgi:hypothetical protein
VYSSRVQEELISFWSSEEMLRSQMLFGGPDEEDTESAARNQNLQSIPPLETPRMMTLEHIYRFAAITCHPAPPF